MSAIDKHREQLELHEAGEVSAPRVNAVAQIEDAAVGRGQGAHSILEQVEAYRAEVGHFEVASLQVNFASLPYEASRRSVALFGREVLPKLRELDRLKVG